MFKSHPLASLQIPPKRFTVRPYLLILLSGFVIASAELFLRVVWTLPKLPEHELFVQHDPWLGWKKIPHLKKLYISDEYETLEMFNSQGIRGPEYPDEKTNNEYRILVLGDSHSEGYTVEFEKLFSEVLKKRLNDRKDRPYQVINAATRAYSTDQELIFFEREGRRLHPDLTVLMFSATNIWNNNQSKIGNQYKPLFRLNGNSLELTQVPVPPPDLRPDTAAFLRRHCYLCRVVFNEIKKTPLFTWALKFRKDANRSYLMYQEQESRFLHDAWRITEALLLALKQRVQQTGGDFLVVQLPISDQMDDTMWEETRKKRGLLGEGWDLTRINKKLKAFCEKNDIDFLDPLQKFRSAEQRLRAAHRTLYFRCGHWTEEGHALVGNILEKHVREKYLGS